MTMRDAEVPNSRVNRDVKDLCYIMMCAIQDHWTSTGIISYNKLNLDHSRDVSRTIFVNVDSCNLGFPYFNFFGGPSVKNYPV